MREEEFNGRQVMGSSLPHHVKLAELIPLTYHSATYVILSEKKGLSLLHTSDVIDINKWLQRTCHY